MTLSWWHCQEIIRLDHRCLKSKTTGMHIKTIYLTFLSNLLWKPITALFGGGRVWGRGAKKKALLFQFTIHIHIQKPAAMCSVATKLRGLALCAFIYYELMIGMYDRRDLRKLFLHSMSFALYVCRTIISGEVINSIPYYEQPPAGIGDNSSTRFMRVVKIWEGREQQAR